MPLYLSKNNQTSSIIFKTVYCLKMMQISFSILISKDKNTDTSSEIVNVNCVDWNSLCITQTLEVEMHQCATFNVDPISQIQYWNIASQLGIWSCHESSICSSWMFGVISVLLDLEEGRSSFFLMQSVLHLNIKDSFIILTIFPKLFHPSHTVI